MQQSPLCLQHILPFNKVFIFTKNYYYYYYFTCHLLVEQKTDVVLPGTKTDLCFSKDTTPRGWVSCSIGSSWQQHGVSLFVPGSAGCFSLSPTGGKAQSKTPGQAAAARGVFLTKTSRNVQRQKPSSRVAVSACTCRLCLRTAFLLSSHCPQSPVLQNDALSVLLLPAYICRGNKLLLLAFARLLRHLYMSVTSL